MIVHKHIMSSGINISCLMLEGRTYERMDMYSSIRSCHWMAKKKERSFEPGMFEIFATICTNWNNNCAGSYHNVTYVIEITLRLLPEESNKLSYDLLVFEN